MRAFQSIGLRAGLLCTMLLWAWGQTAAEPLVETYKQNFFLTTVDRLDHEDNRQNDEVKFQISFKVELIELSKSSSFYLGYTQKSFWQIYHDSSSRPFRENNFNPEVFFDFNSGEADESLWGLQIGFEHESNGRGFEFQQNGGQINTSRSWNRIYVHPKWRWNKWFLVAFKYWYRLPEGEPSTDTNPDGDDNPDIADFLGHAELRFALQVFDDHQLLGFFRRGRQESFHAYQLDYLFKLSKPDKPEVYLQFHYFNGYGESLIDYNQAVRKIGIGIGFGSPIDSMIRTKLSPSPPTPCPPLACDQS